MSAKGTISEWFKNKQKEWWTIGGFEESTCTLCRRAGLFVVAVCGVQTARTTPHLRRDLRDPAEADIPQARLGSHRALGATRTRGADSFLSAGGGRQFFIRPFYPPFLSHLYLSAPFIRPLYPTCICKYFCSLPAGIEPRPNGKNCNAVTTVPTAKKAQLRRVSRY